MKKSIIFLIILLLLLSLLIGYRLQFKNPPRTKFQNELDTRTENFSLVHDGLTRTYRVHLPPCYQNSEIPLVIVFHGGGGSADAAEIGLGMNQKSDQSCFIAVYPDGVSTSKEKKDQHWNAGSSRIQTYNLNVDDVGFVSEMLNNIENQFVIDKKRIYATGISNGAMMAYTLACRLSDRIAAIAPVSGGLVIDDCQPKNPVSIIHFHGTSDPGWPYSGGHGCFTKDSFKPIKETIETWKTINKCTNETKVTFQNGGVRCNTNSCYESEITFCTIEGGGHTWPGGYSFPIENALPWDSDCALGKGRGVGKVSEDIIARDAMWEFFKNHPKK